LTQDRKDGWSFSKSIKILAIWRTYTGGADINSSQLQGHISTVAEERSGTSGNRVFARKRNRVAREEKPTQSAWPKGQDATALGGVLLEQVRWPAS
jgi:hypothetical protein